jgi:hypothetical protein
MLFVSRRGDADVGSAARFKKAGVCRGTIGPRHHCGPGDREPALPARDRFVLARLEKEGLKPSPEADRVTLLRRLSLDLIGLPPTPEEVDAFLADTTPRRLREGWSTACWPRRTTASAGAGTGSTPPATPTPTATRRTSRASSGSTATGSSTPQPRPALRPFIIEQIAGDLLPGATQDQVVATGFLRNSMINEEGGVDPEQFRMEAMFDRMDAIGKGVLGLTIQCAQCHNHKYDPLTQEEYYRLFAFLNNDHEANARRLHARGADEAGRPPPRRSARSRTTCAPHPDWRERMARGRTRSSDDQPKWTSCGPSRRHLDRRPEVPAAGRTARSWPRATRRPSTRSR